jgi:hypothetical protein
MIHLDTVKFSRALQKSAGDQQLIGIVIDIYNATLLGPQGVFNKQISFQGFKFLKDKYRNRKRKQGYDQKQWVRTGSFRDKTATLMSTIKDDGKVIKWSARRKTSSLEVHRAIGRGKGEKSKNEKTKRAIFWGNQLRRPFVSYSNSDIENAKTAAGTRLVKIFKELGISN